MKRSKKESLNNTFVFTFSLNKNMTLFVLFVFKP